MTAFRSLWQWAVEESGNPASWGPRGQAIAQTLIDLGLQPEHQVLEIGCGALSLGKPLMRYLEPGHYCALEPAGWLVEAARTETELEARGPAFLWRDDFNAARFERTFDFVVSHDFLSHAAHHQLRSMLAEARKVSRDGTVFLCSYRRDSYNSWNEHYVPSVTSTFRLETVRSAAWSCAWRAEPDYDTEAKIKAACPTEDLNWVRMVAVTPLEEQQALLDAETQRLVALTTEVNELRMAEEDVQDTEQADLRLARFERIAALGGEQ